MQTILASYKPRIDAYIRNYIESQSVDIVQVNSWQKDAYSRLLSFVNSGKSIRGALFLWSKEQYMGSLREADIALASSIELIHSGFLIHDDIMDTDRFRRGQRTIFSQFEEIGTDQQIEQSTDFGKNLAICVGDLALFLGMDCMRMYSIDSGPLQSILQEFASVCIAQMQDVSFGMNTILPSIDEVLSMYTYKTARYTFSLPLALGARISNAPQSEIELLEDIGEDMGLIFQLSDDMLNLFGDSSTSGKSVGSDLRDEKKTYAFVMLMNALSETDAVMLKKTVDSDARVSLLYELLNSYHIHSTVLKKIDELSLSVNASIQKLSLSESSKQDLITVNSSLKKREK